MSSGKHQEIWLEQCQAARTTMLRYGLKAAFDYAVGEKLMNFAEAAHEHPAFARELPRFISEVRRIFSADELRVHLARLEREQSERDGDFADLDDDDLHRECPASAAARARQFAVIKELLPRPLLARLEQTSTFAGRVAPGTAKRRRIVRNSYRLSLNLPSMCGPSARTLEPQPLIEL
jgi:hypothetical protein